MQRQLRSIEGSRVCRYYGEERALYRCSFKVEAGDAIALLGPNGAGKSTLLSLLATLSRPSEGELLANGRLDLWQHRQSLRSHIGLVAHDALLYGDLTGRENVELYAKLYGRDSQEVDDWLERVGLSVEEGARLASSYSRGMRQRLAIARALINDPTLVLFDEPQTGLDRQGQEWLWKLIRELKGEGRMVLVVTHRFDAPLDVFDRAWVFANGRLKVDQEVREPLASIYDAALSSSSRRGGQ